MLRDVGIKPIPSSSPAEGRDVFDEVSVVTLGPNNLERPDEFRQQFLCPANNPDVSGNKN